MPKKRTSAEVNNDEETNEGSDPVLQQEEDNAKRVKLTPLSDKTLQDLTIQLLKRILVKAVLMEVKGMKLAKSVWKEKADLVISRLKDVSLHWSSILTTNEFLTEVHRILDDTAQKTIRFEILHQSTIPFLVFKVTTMKEEIFMLCSGEEAQDIINVYDRNNMAEVKDVIALPEAWPLDIEGCNVTNCVYVLCVDLESNSIGHSVLRITKDEEHHFNVLPWISGLRYPNSSKSVLPNGVLSVSHGQDPVILNHYNANGSLVLSADIYGFSVVDRVIQKSNGNLLLASINGDQCDRVLTEIDTNAKIQRQYISSNGNRSSVHSADMCGRIMIHKLLVVTGEIELLDSELNPLDFVGLQQEQSGLLERLHFSSERNEIFSRCLVVDDDVDDDNNNYSSVLTIFRFTEE